MGIDGIKDAYTTGRGRIIMRGRATIEELPSGKEMIIISEIPYQVNKANLVEKIAHLVRDKKLEGISDLRDESDKDGIRVVIECKRDAIADIILNNSLLDKLISWKLKSELSILVNSSFVRLLKSKWLFFLYQHKKFKNFLKSISYDNIVFCEKPFSKSRYFNHSWIYFFIFLSGIV